MLIKAVDLYKDYPMGEGVVEVIKGVNLEIFEGESISLIGPSGAGKSTLLYLLAGIEGCSQGEIYWKGKNISALPDENRAQFRRKEIGFIFQFFNLLPELSALENIILPGLIDNQPKHSVRKKAEEILKEFNMEKRASHYPHSLSGGESQRVAIARALINNPQIIFADEPTGNLDKETGERILELLLTLNQKEGKTLFLATHQENIAVRMNRIVRIIDGKLQKGA